MTFFCSEDLISVIFGRVETRRVEKRYTKHHFNQVEKQDSNTNKKKEEESRKRKKKKEEKKRPKQIS